MDRKIWQAWDGVSPNFASQKYPRGVLQDAGSQLFTSKTVPLGVGCSELYMAAEEIRIRELAFTCATNLIAKGLFSCLAGYKAAHLVKERRPIQLFAKRKEAVQ